MSFNEPPKGSRTRQHIIGNLGRREDVEAGGDLERLAASAARLSRTAIEEALFARRRDRFSTVVFLDTTSLYFEGAGGATLGGAGQDRFAIDRDKVEADAKFDGVFALRTNTAFDPLAAMRRYKQLWTVEQVFRTTKDMLGTRPIFHKRDETIRGHVFCSFLAPVLKKELADIPADLDRVRQVEIAHRGKRVLRRTPLSGTAGKVFQATRVARPPAPGLNPGVEPAARA